MKRYVKKIKKEIEFSQIWVRTDLYECLREIKFEGKFKNMNETIAWLMNSANTLLSKSENREMLKKELGEQKWL